MESCIELLHSKFQSELHSETLSQKAKSNHHQNNVLILQILLLFLVGLEFEFRALYSQSRRSTV
jgi:hypothetical protein